MAERYGANRHALAVAMAGQLGEAVRDMPDAAPRELFERFVVWTGPR